MFRRPTSEAIEIMSEQEVLVADHVVVRYGKMTAVRGASLNVKCGEVAIIIGPNSAGKSSLLEAVGAKIPGRTIEGSASLGGHSLLNLGTRERWKIGVRLVPQGRQIYPSLTVADNLRVIAENVGVEWNDVLETTHSLLPAQFSERLKLRLRVPAGNLSGGEQQMLALARVLVGKVSMLLLDEPGLGLAPRITQEFAAAIGQWAKAGIGILMTDQALRRWVRVVNRVYILVRGHLSEYGQPEESIDQLIAQMEK
jgi:branched-chain amino acid transport system ATP-binding protein